MVEQQLKKIRPLGKLEEISAAAHHIDFFTNTGLSVHYRASSPSLTCDLRETIYNALAHVVRLHTILFAVPIVADGKEPYWGRLPSIDLKQTVSFVKRSLPLTIDDEGRDRELDTLLQNQHNISFKSAYGTLPVWRLIILQDHEAKYQFTACFVAHHSMSDGIGLQIFQNSLQKALCEASSSSLTPKAEHIIFSNDDDPIAPSLEELHPLPVPVNAKPAEVNATVLNEWTGNPVQVPCKTRYVSLSLAPQIMKPFTQECRKHKVAATAALPSLIAKLLYNNLPRTVESLTCNLPVSLRSDLPPKLVDGVMGNFIDAFKVKLLRSDLDEEGNGDSSIADSTSSNETGIWNHARRIQEGTRRYFSNVSPSGQPFTNIAFFKLIPDLRAALTATLGNERGESFEISNLGAFSQPKNPKGGPSPVWKTGKVMLSRCAYAAGGPLVVCVLSGSENIGLGFTWQEGAIADEVVENVLNGVRKYFVNLSM